MRSGQGEAGDRKRSQSIRRATRAASTIKVAAVDPSQLNFSYKIDGPNVPWKPVRAFDDRFARLSPDAGGNEVERSAGAADRRGQRHPDGQLPGAGGDYYVVDRLFEKGVLLAGVGRQQDRVTIAYAGGAR